ncbi:hypothetical protein AC1031_013829 [Aphanomyces cochlioides]|nr:hypothetical protein AC1031_013829 [Aphanomyces cochlioides]
MVHIPSVHRSKLASKARAGVFVGAKEKSYIVQLEPNGVWTWVAAISLPASTLVYEFERDRLHLDRLDTMVQTDFVPPNDDEDEEETKSEAGEGEEDDSSQA